MTHEEADGLLDAWIDQELDPLTENRLRLHVAGCAACGARLSARQSLKKRLQSTTLRHPLPRDLELRVRARLGIDNPSSARDSIPHGVDRDPRPVWSRWSLAAAASLAFAVAGFIVGGEQERAKESGARFAAAHERALLAGNGLDVRSSDHHTVKPWLAQSLSFSPPVPESPGPDDRLLGARVDFVAHQRVAVLVYQRGNHLVDVYVWPRDAGREPVAREVQVDGFQVLDADLAAFRVVMVSDLGAREFADFRDAWRRLAQS